MSALPQAQGGEVGGKLVGQVVVLRQRFREGKAALLEHFGQSRPTAPAATRLIRALARHVDTTLCELWNQSALPSGAALVAVGGYGRGELFPYSDVDVLILLPTGLEAESIRSPIETFVTACWDIGLEIGSSVRNIAECVAEAGRDVTVQTAMLEAR